MSRTKYLVVMNGSIVGSYVDHDSGSAYYWAQRAAEKLAQANIGSDVYLFGLEGICKADVPVTPKAEWTYE